MRGKLLTIVIGPAVMGGCATGYATDWFRDRPGIIRPQLLRYGLDVEQSRCVSERLGARLSRQDLRQFEERAVAVRPAAGAVLTLANLRAIAGASRGVRGELDSVLGTCNVPLTVAAVPAVPAAQTIRGGAGSAPVTTDGNVPATPVAVGATAAWLNLGSAESGQSIGIDARSIEQEGPTRIAWFRMTDPDSGAMTNNAYRLKIDCEARTIQPLALRRTDASGAEVSLRQYIPGEAEAGPAEAGTVLEIAFLSMCT